MAYTSASIVGQQDTLHSFALVLNFGIVLALVLNFGIVLVLVFNFGIVLVLVFNFGIVLALVFNFGIVLALALRRRGTRERLERRVGGSDLE
jgi:hypothetical protein